MCMALVMPFMINGLVSTGYVNIAWYLTLGLMVTHSLFSVLINTLQTGFIAQFPETDTNFMSLYMVGQVTNSIVVLLIQVFVLLAMNANDLYTTTIVYFMAVVAIIFSILMTFIFVVLRHPIVKDMLEKKQKTDELKKSQDKNTLRESVKMQEAITWA